MSDRTAIEWTDATWNPWVGCDKVSPGCAKCYMFDGQQRYGQDPSVVRRTSRQTFTSPLRWPRPQRVFTCSWSDFFHEHADPWRPDAWDIIRATPHLTYQVLTKRPERIRAQLPADWGAGWPHVWLGTSIENRRFVHRADTLRAVPAAVRFISAEPLLGPLDGLELVGTQWLIAGGESGPKRRRLDVDWVRDLRDRCAAAGVAFFMKQDAGPRPGRRGRFADERQWPREFPSERRRVA